MWPDGEGTGGGSGAAVQTVSTLVSEAVRNDAQFKGVLEKFGGKTPDDLVKGYLNAEQLATRKLDGYIKRPGEGAKPEEIAAYHVALGAPETPDGYEVPKIEGIQIDDNRLKTFRDIAHKNGLTQAQAAALIQYDFETNQAARAAEESDYQEKHVKRLFPKGMTEALDTGKRTIARIAEKNPEFAKELEPFLGKDAHFTKLVELLAGEFAEGNSLSANEFKASGRGIDTEIADLEKKLNDPKTTNEERKMYRNQMADLIYQNEGVIKV